MNANQEYDYLFKYVLVGNSSVGKSATLLRFAENKFNEHYQATIGVDFRFRTLDIDGKRAKIQIWDTAGQERFRTITSAYYKGAHAIILVYDITRKTSFKEIATFWLNEVDSYADENVKLLLLGNKRDVKEDREVPREEAERFAKAKGMLFAEVTAKFDEGVSDAFEQVTRAAIITYEENKKETPSKETISPAIANLTTSEGGLARPDKVKKESCCP